MLAITITDLNNAGLDAAHMAAIATSPALTATDRLGVTKKTMAGLAADYPQATANAAAALSSALASEASRQASGASAGAAATAKAAAEAARDAATINGKVYATTAAGLAATTTTQYFTVPSPDSAEHLILYLNNAGVAVEQKRYPSARLSLLNRDKIGGNPAYTPAPDVGLVVSGVAVADVARLWMNIAPLMAGELRTLRAHIQTVGNGSGSFVIVRPGTPFTVMQIFPMTGIAATGLLTFTLPAEVRVAAGDIIGWHMAVGGALVASFPSPGVTNRFFTTATIAVGQTFTANATTDQLSLSATVAIMSEVIDERVSALETSLDNIYREPTTALGTSVPDSADSSNSFVWTTVDPTKGAGLVSAIRMRFSQAGSGTLYVIVPNAALSGLVVFGIYPISVAAGLNTLVPGSDAAKAQCPTLPSTLLLPAGSRIGYTRIAGTSVRQATQAGALTFHIVGATAVGAAVTLSAVSNGAVVAIEVTYTTRQDLPVGPSAGDAIESAVGAATGSNVDVYGKFNRLGVATDFRGTLVHAVAAGADIRYDVIYYDFDALTLGIQAGTARTIDPSEFIPALTDSKRRALFNVRVTSAGVVDVVPVWEVQNGEVRVLESELRRERKRSRACLPKTLAKIRRGAALKIVSFGDSIVAIQSTTTSLVTPNGAVRDVAAAPLTDVNHYLRDSIGADVVNAMPLYTSVQLGRADDGAGAIHSKFGFVWDLVTSIQAAGGAVTYDNFGVGGSTSSQAVSGAALSAWGLAVAALAPDLVIVNFGMNERGVTTTEANIVIVCNAFKALGIETVCMGVARPNGSLVGWDYTNRAIGRAAQFTNAAYVPMMPLYDNKYIGAIGCSTLDASAANRINHPGIAEHKAIGRELIKLVQDT